MRSQSCRWLNGLIKRLIYLRVRCNVGLCEIYTPPPSPPPPPILCVKITSTTKIYSHRPSVWWARFTCFTFYRIMLPILRSISWSLYLQCSIVCFHKRMWVVFIHKKKRKKYIVYADWLQIFKCLKENLLKFRNEYNYLIIIYERGLQF